MAVWPPEEVLDRLAALPRPDIPGIRWTEREQWHVTLRFLGSVADAAPVVEALEGLDVAETEAVLGPAVGRFGRRVLQVPVAGLEELAGAVVRATSHLGRPPDDRPFAGHITLARVAKAANVGLGRRAGTPVHARWAVREYCLVESRVSAGARQYDSFNRFPLNNHRKTADQ